MACGFKISNEVERRGFGSRHSHGARLSLHIRRWCPLEMAFREEADPGPAGRSHSELHIGDDLKLLGLVVSGAVKSGCADEAHVVRMVVKPHKLVDKP